MTAGNNPGEGWYAQPDGRERYWSGSEWTLHFRPPPPPQPATHLVPTPAGYLPTTQVAPKSPGLALLGSFFVPGLGQLMNGSVGKGIGIFLGYLVSWMLVIVFVGLIGVVGFWVWGMVDAYQGARTWNARYGILS